VFEEMRAMTMKLALQSFAYCLDFLREQVQVLVGHTANHTGQLSVWRRAMGLPPMGRPFE
jgi:hypothetical protein